MTRLLARYGCEHGPVESLGACAATQGTRCRMLEQEEEAAQVRYFPERLDAEFSGSHG
jgi:hypothetical protein